MAATNPECLQARPRISRSVYGPIVAVITAAGLLLAGLTAPSANAFEQQICGNYGTYVNPQHRCPSNPNGHTWVYNEAWCSVANNNYNQPFQEVVYHGDNADGDLLSARTHYGNGYVDSGADLNSHPTWTKRAYAFNASTWANTTLHGYAHT